jgi:hypothetical protein
MFVRRTVSVPQLSGCSTLQFYLLLHSKLDHCANLALLLYKKTYLHYYARFK